MNFGMVLIILSFTLTLVTAYFYFVSTRGSESALRASRKIYLATFAFIMLSSLYFLYLILTHSFQYDYIYRYSSRSLPLGYLISSFWAGQEGSYLLWSLFISTIGLIFYRTAKQFESWSMLFILLIQAFLLFLMIDKSPFEMLPQTPSDGAGLNPLLQDPWMVIHPPLLFLGYAAITVPFALALAALLKRDFNGWLKHALPWSLFSSITLGAGIIIGGFWAYEVLGWGGYWGWDPVENSSLIPWLIVLALFHGLLIERMKGAFTKFNIILSVLSLLLVIYATFLTRSGVLANFSVHSFQANGQYIYLNLFIIGLLVLSTVLFLRSYKSIPGAKIDIFKISRESGLFWCMIVFCVSALFIFIGTSSPIITGLVGSNPSQVDVGFYNKVNFPVGIFIGLLMGVTPLLIWGNAQNSPLSKNIFYASVLAVISTVVGYFFGVKEIKLLVFILSGAFAFWANVITIFLQAKISRLNIGGPLSHLGVAMLLIGIIASGNYSESKQVKLKLNEKGSIYNYNILYKGITDTNNGKTQINLDLEKDGSVFHSSPKLYFSTYNNAWAREPFIKIMPAHDLYITVLEREFTSDNNDNTMTLLKGNKANFSDYLIEFIGFEFGNHQMGQTVQIGANLKVTYEGREYGIKPTMIFDSRKISDAVALPSKSGGAKTLSLTNIDADQKMIELTFSGFQSSQTPEDVVLIEVSKKPLMNFVWFGSTLLTFGTVIAFKRRFNSDKYKN
jgi:cytochrome c-type biogenesis protein CcmF